MKLLSVREAAKELCIAPCTARRLIKDGKIQHRLVGKRQFFTEDDLSAYLESCLVPVKPSLHHQEVQS